MNPISVFILGDERIRREGLRSLLQSGDDLNVVGDAQTVDELFAGLGRSLTEIVLIDLSMPICALDAVERILSIAPSTHVIVLSRFLGDPKIVSVTAGALRRVHASAFLPNDLSARELVAAMHRVLLGDTLFPAESANFEGWPVFRPVGGPWVLQPALTLRQTQVLKLVAEGLATKQIADRLSISPKTVEKHRQILKEKLHTNNAADLARRAIGLGLVHAV